MNVSHSLLICFSCNKDRFIPLYWGQFIVIFVLYLRHFWSNGTVLCFCSFWPICEIFDLMLIDEFSFDYRICESSKLAHIGSFQFNHAQSICIINHQMEIERVMFGLRRVDFPIGKTYFLYEKWFSTLICALHDVIRHIDFLFAKLVLL